MRSEVTDPWALTLTPPPPYSFSDSLLFLPALSLAHRSVLRWTQQQLSAGFQRWVEWCADLAAQRGAANHALVMWRNRELAAGWNQWREVVENARLAIAAMRRSIFRWMKRRLSAGFQTWIQYIEQIRAHTVSYTHLTLPTICSV